MNSKSNLILPGQPAVAQPIDAVFSRLKLEEGEMLLVKLPAGTPPVALQQCGQMLATALGRERAHRMVLFPEGAIEFTKISFEDAAKGPEEGRSAFFRGCQEGARSP